MIVVCIFINEIDYFKRWAIKLKASKSFLSKVSNFWPLGLGQEIREF